MKFISWNVNGLRACNDKGFSDIFRQLDADFFCLQETKMQAGQLDLEFEGYRSYWNYAEKKGYSGTAIFTKHEPLSVTYGIDIEHHDKEGRVITLEMPDFYLVTVYTPNSQDGLKRLDYRMTWDDDFRAYLQELDKKKPVVVCGDLNVAHKEIDLKNPKSNRKNAGFTGVRLGWTIVPETLSCDNAPAGTVHRLWNRRQTTFFNGASNIAQAGGLAALSDEGRAACLSLVDYYKGNARIIRSGLESIGLTCYGGVDSPYVWAACPGGMSSWEFFDFLLDKAHVVVTPGSGFGAAGEGYVRVSAYGHREDVEAAIASIKENLHV